MGSQEGYQLRKCFIDRDLESLVATIRELRPDLLTDYTKDDDIVEPIHKSKPQRVLLSVENDPYILTRGSKNSRPQCRGCSKQIENYAIRIETMTKRLGKITRAFFCVKPQCIEDAIKRPGEASS